MHGRTVRPETIAAYRRFRDALARCGTGEDARGALMGEYGGTYFYYRALVLDAHR